MVKNLPVSAAAMGDESLIPGSGRSSGAGNGSGDRPNPGIKPRSPALQAVSLLSEPAGKPNIPIY